MKKIVFIVGVLIISYSSFSQGITFETGSFNQALTKAKKENKYLFVDFYTVWCGPCKKMNKEVFPQEKAGNYFNENLISIKIDAEKGEGVELKKQYNVQAYPTMLFLNNSGKELYRMVGGKSLEEFITGTKNALNPVKRLDVLTKKYNEGERNLEFVLSYINALNDAFDNKTSAEVSKELVKSLPIEKFNTKKMFNILANTDIEYNSEAFNYIVKNNKQLLANVNSWNYNKTVINTVSKHLTNKAKTVSTLEELKHEIKKVNKRVSFLEEKQLESLEKESTYKFFTTQKDFKNWFQLKMQEANKYKGTEDYKYRLHTIGSDALGIPAFIDSDDCINRVFKMANTLVANKDSFIIGNLLLAKVYFKLKDKEKAMNCLNIFIDKHGLAGDRKAYTSISMLKTAIESL